MSIWDRLKGALRPPEPAPSKPPADESEPPGPPAEAPVERSEAQGDGWLRTLLTRLSDTDASPEAQANARAAIGSEQFWTAIAQLLSAGRERTALELLGRFAAARPDDTALALRLAELLVDRRDDRAARPLLEKLLSSPEQGLRARFLYAELCERAGDLDGARRHFETLLAVDLDFPKARARADALARPPAARVTPAAAPTLDGLSEGNAPFAGRYRLVRELGRGASGAVYVAHDQELDRELALKILHPHARAADRAQARVRAFLEARVAASIRHPGVVAIYDLDEERQLIAMELCSGGALRERLARGPVSVEAAIRRAAELLDTLAAVHQRGVVHGDVKPANLLHRGDPDHGDLVLGDFGVARLAGDDAGAAGGTLGYMAPEQRRGELAPPGDVYAAGMILVELLSGSAALQPWLSDRQALLAGAAFPSETRALPGSPELHRLIAQLLDPQPARRPDAASSARALRGMLEHAP
jgi:serine/threonine-protein kinase